MTTNYEADIRELRVEVLYLKNTQSEANKKLDEIQETLSEARGGWRVLLAQYGFVAAIAGGIAWALDHLSFR